MPEIRRILVIDDDPGVREALTESFEADQIEVAFCLTKDDGMKRIDSGDSFDAVLLDWYLEVDNSSLSQLILAHLRSKRFVPVFIWSQQIEDFRQELAGGGIQYPESLIRDISKLEFNQDQVKRKINELYDESVAAKISHTYRDVIASTLEEVFFDLASMPHGDIALILKSIIGDQGNIDWSNDFILNLIHRKLVGKIAFTTQLIDLITSIPPGEAPADEAARRTITNQILYFKSPSNSIHCGDIVKLRSGENIKYGIVATPDCDIEQAKTRFIDLIEIRKLDEASLDLNAGQKEEIRKYNHASFYYLPSVYSEANFEDFVVILKSRLVLEEIVVVATPKFPSASKKLQYSDHFTYNGQAVEVQLICTFTNPYKSDFLHRLQSHTGRVGTPDIKNLWIGN